MTRRLALVSLACAVACRGADVTVGPDACGSAAAPTVVGAGLDTGVVLGGTTASCLQLNGGAGDYLVSVQLAGASLSYSDYAVDVAPLGARIAPATSSLTMPAPRSNALAFEAGLRASEQEMARRAIGARPLELATRGLTRSVPALGSIDTFKVVGTLNAPYTYVASAARLVYRGSRVLAYVDVNTPAVWTDAEWQALGAHLEDPLYGVDTTAFGQPSDLDGNARVIVLFTPKINALVSQIECARSGFVTGYFYAFDLASTSTDSNQGEIFFAYVPDPSGTFSCPHTGAEVKSQLPATFVHEFQHMISYGQHAIARGGITEEVWLNEGLSHLAEELASLYYEGRYPPPSGRTSSFQLFPDSSNDFIAPNLGNAYRWLQVPSAFSPVRYPAGSYGTLEERGASWLFCRYLVDRFGPNTTRQLLQTNRWGDANVEATTGVTMPRLLADFSLALWLDSLPGQPRLPLASPRRFRSRNLRQLFNALVIARPSVGIGFPLVPLSVASTRRATLHPGSTEFFRVTVPAGGLRLAIRQPDGQAPSSTWQLQVGVLRLSP
jgi:hypothetical protein